MSDSTIEINVVNMSAQTTRSGAYTMKVPFSSLSRTMQFIHRAGGKVVDVKNSTPIAAPAATANVASASVTANQTAQRIAQDRSKQGGKQTKK